MMLAIPCFIPDGFVVGGSSSRGHAHGLYKRRATPAWANRFMMSEIRKLARLRSKMLGHAWSVDHIVPLRSHLVCGLHCEDNLRVITKRQNSIKRNKHWPDMP